MPLPSTDDRLAEPGTSSPDPPKTPGFPGAVPASYPPSGDDLPPPTPGHVPRGDSLRVRCSRAVVRTVYTDAFPNQWAEAVEACQHPVTTGRRIGVLSPTGGSGASTLTAATAALLASVRTDPVAVLDLCAAPSGLLPRLPSTQTGRSLGQLSRPPRPDSDQISAERVDLEEADLTQFGVPTPPRLRRLTYSTDDSALNSSELRALHRGLSRTYATAVCELPRPSAAPEGMGSYGMHALVLALSPAPGDLEANREVLVRIRRQDPEVPILPVLVNARRHRRRTCRSAAASLRDILQAIGAEQPLRRLDADRHLAAGMDLSISAVGEARRLQIAQLSAAALSAAREGRR